MILVTNGMHLDSLVLGLHSVTMFKNNTLHYEKKNGTQISGEGFFEAALNFIIMGGG